MYLDNNLKLSLLVFLITFLFSIFIVELCIRICTEKNKAKFVKIWKFTDFAWYGAAFFALFIFLNELKIAHYTREIEERKSLVLMRLNYIEYISQSHRKICTELNQSTQLEQVESCGISILISRLFESGNIYNNVFLKKESKNSFIASELLDKNTTNEIRKEISKSMIFYDMYEINDISIDEYMNAFFDYSASHTENILTDYPVLFSPKEISKYLTNNTERLDQMIDIFRNIFPLMDYPTPPSGVLINRDRGKIYDLENEVLPLLSRFNIQGVWWLYALALLIAVKFSKTYADIRV